MQKTFDKNYLTRTLGLPDSGYAISDKIVDNDRWTVEHELIFQDPADGKYYKSTYHVGATELQEDKPWEYEPFVRATEVQRRMLIKDEFIDTEAPASVLTLESVLQDIQTAAFHNENGEGMIRLSDVEQIMRPLLDIREQEAFSTEVTQETASPVTEVPVTEPGFLIDPDEFQGFFEKLKKKMDDVLHDIEEEEEMEYE